MSSIGIEPSLPTHMSSRQVIGRGVVGKSTLMSECELPLELISKKSVGQIGTTRCCRIKNPPARPGLGPPLDSRVGLRLGILVTHRDLVKSAVRMINGVLTACECLLDRGTTGQDDGMREFERERVIQLTTSTLGECMTTGVVGTT